jgi:hypothetical protein
MEVVADAGRRSLIFTIAQTLVEAASKTRCGRVQPLDTQGKGEILGGREPHMAMAAAGFLGAGQRPRKDRNSANAPGLRRPAWVITAFSTIFTQLRQGFGVMRAGAGESAGLL